MKKKVMTLALTTALVAATGAAAHADEGKYTIGYTYYYNTEFITLMNKGIEEKAKELGVDVIMLDAENDSANQITQVENLIAQDVDCLYVAAVDGDAIVPALGMAQEANKPIVFVNMEVNTDEEYYYSGPDDTLAGELEARSAIEKIGGEGQVAILQGPIGSSAMAHRQEGNDKVLEEYKDKIECVAVQPANWSREEAETLVENWMQSFPELKAIIAHNDEMALGAIQAIEGAGKVPGVDIIVTGIDAIEDGCNAVKDGKLYSTVYQDAGLEGSQGIQICYDILEGNAPEEKMNLINMTNYTQDTVQELIDKLYK